VIDLGPVALHMYGLTLLVAIAACIALTGYRWVRWGGDWDLVFRVAVWGVAFGIVGARAYHDITSYDQDPAIKEHWWGPFAVWKGGLGVWGGILLGCLVGAWIVRRTGNSVRLFMDAVAPGLLLAQGIGRWGNWWNQELYGKPTKYFWGLKIDIDHQGSIAPKYRNAVAYHPTFLYEFIYDSILAVVLILVGRVFRIRPPGLFALYVAVYTFGRFFEELLRIDPSHHVFGLRLNAVVCIVLFALSVLFFVYWQFIRRAPEPAPRARQPIVLGPSMAIPKRRGR
jgi:prolipoprotein diacylglyceryl transferase